MKDFSEILERKIGVKNISEILSTIPNNVIAPLLIEVFRNRSKKTKAVDLLRLYEEKEKFYGISPISQKEIIKFQNEFYDVLPLKFKDVECSPILPLGANSVITNLSQDKLMSTTRNSEVSGDPTTALAFYAASIRKKLAKEKETINDEVNLATIQRVLRMQPFDYSKGYMQHFNLIGIITSRRTSNYTDFISSVLKEHILLWCSFIEKLNKSTYEFKNVNIYISNLKITEKIIEHNKINRSEVFLNTGEIDYDFFKKYNIKFPEKCKSIYDLDEDIIETYGLKNIINQMKKVEDNLFSSIENYDISIEYRFNRIKGLGYYKDYCIHIFSDNNEGKEEQLSDGGSVNYIENLLSDKKEVAFTSGFGAELIQRLYKK